MKKTILIGSSAIISIVFVLYVVFGFGQHTLSPARTGTGASAHSVPSTDQARTQAFMKIGSADYTLDVSSHTTLFEAMRALEEVGTVQFTSKEYPGLGYFVDSLEGVSNERGRYWVFYVNGRSSTVGVSTLLLHAGDTIEWKYEHSY